MALFDRLLRRTTEGEALTAAGERIDLSDSSSIDAVLKRRQSWYKQSFNTMDSCGEIHDGVTKFADLVSRVRIYAAEQPKEKDAAPERTTNPDAIETLERLGTVERQATILHDSAVQYLLVGDWNFCGIQPADDRPTIDTERWEVFSVEETEKDSYPTGAGTRVDTLRINDYFGNGQNLVLRPDASDTFIRIWRRSARKKQQATSHVRPLISHVEELLWWDSVASAVAKNRLALSGMIGVPSNLELPIGLPGESRNAGNKAFIKRLFDNAVRAISNPGDPSSAVPIFYSYPANEQGKSGIDVTEFDRKQDELLELRTDRCLRRIAQGFPLPPEEFFGLSESTHWTGGTISKEKFSTYIEPSVIFLMAAYTEAWFRPILRQTVKDDADKYLLWFDASELVVHPDMGQAADKGLEYGAINYEAWRRTRGFKESDAPSDEEQEALLEWMRALRGREQIQAQPAEDADDPTQVGKQPPAPEKHAPEDQPTPAMRGKGQPILSAANGQGDALISSLRVYCDMSLRRALEKANSKLWSRATKNPTYKESARGVNKLEIAATLGPDAVTKLGVHDVFDSAFDDAPRRVVAITASAVGDVSLTPTFSRQIRRALELRAAELLYHPPTDDLLVSEDFVCDILDNLSKTRPTG